MINNTPLALMLYTISDMVCPNCKQEMRLQKVEHQSIFHCSKCGGTFFEDNGINRISISAAENLAKDTESNEILSDTKTCPRDNIPLGPLTHNEAVPNTVTLLQCNQCRGVFAYPDDLVRFKQAQLAKIQYFKIWNIPLPGLKSVLLAAFAFLVSAALLSTFLKQQLVPTQAEDIVKNIHVSQSTRYLFISFRTESPYTSRIMLTNKVTGETIEKPLQTTPATLHYLTFTNIDLDGNWYYQIIISDKQGKEFRTKEVKLELK